MRYFTLFILFLTSTSLHALDLKLPFNNKTEFLPVQEAFQFSLGTSQANQIKVSWQIAEGYYLYQHQFKVTDKSESPSQIAFAPFPQGEAKTDAYFGDVIVYRDYFEAILTYDATLTPGTNIKANLRFQGCADKGLCYPPQTLPIEFEVPNIKPTAPLSPQAEVNAPAQSQTNQVISLIENANMINIILGLFGLGLLLSLTPCVLPMVPIVSAIVIGSQKKPWQGVYYTLIYILSMAGTYAALGALAGFFGTQYNIQAYLQSPVILIISATIFCLLALAMFGAYELRLPQSLENKLNSLSNPTSKHKSLSIILTGVLATLIVSPCVSAPLAGIVLYVSSQGDPLYGATLMFILALGMGTPLLLVALFGKQILPKAGEWLNDIKVLLGFALLGVAIWLLGRLSLGHYELLLWSLFFAFLGAYFLMRYQVSKHIIRLGLAIVVLILSLVLAIGGASGGKNLLTPLIHLSAKNAQNSSSVEKAAFTDIYSLAELNRHIQTNTNNQPILLDFYADWCISCIIMEEEIFHSPEATPLLKQFILLRADVTENSPENQALLQAFSLYGPPSVLFFDRQGQHIKSLDLIGEPSKSEVIERLTFLLETKR